MAGVEYQVTKVDPTDPETKGMVYQVHKVSEEVAATLGGKVYRARIIKDPTEPTVAGKVYQIVLIGDPSDPAVKGKVYNAILTGGSEAVVVGPAVSPLALDDAIADSLQYVKAFGGTEQRNLPDGYTQLDYITFDASQIIDTGFTPDNNSRIESKCYRTGADCWFYGASPTNPRISLYHSSTGTSRWGNQSLSSVGFVADTEYTIIEDKNGLSINGVANPWASGTAGDFTCDRSLTIGNCNGATGTRYFAGNFYYMKIYDNGVLARDFVPCKNASNVVGLYDRVNGVFYTDAGLVAGPDSVPTPDAPMDIVSNNGALKARHQSGLPLGYTLLEYINTNGGYLDLNYIFTTNNQKKVIKFKDVAAASGSSSPYAICGTQNGFARTAYLALKTSGKIGLGVGSQGAGASSLEIDNPSVPVTVVIETKSDNSLVFSGGSSSYDTTWSGSVQTGSSEFLGKLNITSGTYSANVDVYEYSLYADGALVRELVPVRRNSDNELGMYDLVSGQFFTNAGTGDFVAGNPVSDPVEIYTDGTVETINVHGKNLYNIATRITGYYISASGVPTAESQSYYSALIPVQPNTTYVYSGASNAGNKRLHAYDKDGNWIKQINYTTASIPFATSGTTPANCKYVRISGSIHDTNVQLELGSTATDYVPYFDGGTATAEMLLKVGDYQDVQSILDGAVTRNVGVKVLDGTGSWQLATATDLVQFYTSSTQGVIANNVSLVSTIAPYGCTATNRTQYDFGCYSGGSGNLCFQMKGSATLTTLPAWTQYLADQYAAGTPVIIVYPLATPTTESVAGQTLQVADGDNVLEITQASIDGLQLEAEYEKEGA